MVLKSGSIDDFANSMAAEMEKFFLSEWKKAMPGEAPAVVNNEMRLMFVAVARGVINHLRDNSGSFEVIVKDGTRDIKGTVTKIETNPPKI